MVAEVNTNERIVGRFALGDSTEIRVVESVVNGWKRLDIRQWWKPAGQMEWQPTKKGLNIPASRRADLLKVLGGNQKKPRKARKRRHNKAWAKSDGKKHGIYVGDDPNDEIPPWI